MARPRGDGNSVRKARAAGLRSTRQRAAIVDALRGASGFKTAQDLHFELVRSGERVGLTTVYRNLQTLANAKEIDVLLTASGETMYRLCSIDDHHHHLVCRQCGLSFEISAEEVEAWADRVARRHGFKHVSHTAEIFGSCQKCLAAGS
jgi:Fur family ferric uptake transcriptional regulator